MPWKFPLTVLFEMVLSVPDPDAPAPPSVSAIPMLLLFTWLLLMTLWLLDHHSKIPNWTLSFTIFESMVKESFSEPSTIPELFELTVFDRILRFKDFNA